jgi:hypothetical protein
LRGSPLVHVEQPQPITGTPDDVPVPRKINWPVTSAVTAVRGKVDCGW